MSNVVDVLEVVAKRLGKRTKPCNCFDDNVCQSTAGDHWQPVATSGFPFTRELWADFNQRRINLMANPEFLKCEVQGCLETHPYSIGRPGLDCFTNKPRVWLEVGERRWPVFVPGKDVSLSELQPALDGPTLRKTVNELLPKESESLHFFEGAVVLYSQPATADAVMVALAILAGLVGTAGSELHSPSVWSASAAISDGPFLPNESRY